MLLWCMHTIDQGYRLSSGIEVPLAIWEIHCCNWIKMLQIWPWRHLFHALGKKWITWILVNILYSLTYLFDTPLSSSNSKGHQAWVGPEIAFPFSYVHQNAVNHRRQHDMDQNWLWTKGILWTGSDVIYFLREQWKNSQWFYGNPWSFKIASAAVLVRAAKDCCKHCALFWQCE